MLLWMKLVVCAHSTLMDQTSNSNHHVIIQTLICVGVKLYPSHFEKSVDREYMRIGY
jgi:hypothetical protein